MPSPVARVRAARARRQTRASKVGVPSSVRDMMPGMLATAFQTPAVTGVPPSRRARWSACASDLALGGGAMAVATVLGVAWLLIRTGGGARDAQSGDAAFAFALALAAVPAWLTWLAFDLATRGGTPGQRARLLVVEGAPWRRVLRLAVHPVGAAGWLWLAVVAAIAVLPALTLLFASVATVVLAGGIVTALLTVRRRGEPGVHDRVAGTKLTRITGAHPHTEAP